VKLLILSPQETLLDLDDLQKVRVTLADGGSIGIHSGHHPLLAETITGIIEYGREFFTDRVGVQEGILRVEGDQVIIYTSALTEEQLPVQREAPYQKGEEINILRKRLKEGNQG